MTAGAPSREGNGPVEVDCPDLLVVVPGGLLDLSHVETMASPEDLCAEMDTVHE
jgi:hypothetical protein